MTNNARWTIFGALLAINIVSNVALRGTWYEIVISAVTGLGVIAVVIDYLVRGRGHER
ncbi:hypothetical protein [Actinomadura rubrisoli]|uniref:hypothetical protein n=1 Tax=Actinomadura rubrisoli TaxID=2530368 RepID=UPI001404A5D9|nr:hypothetical protein [Actinomadura rubrisoli]